MMVLVIDLSVAAVRMEIALTGCNAGETRRLSIHSRSNLAILSCALTEHGMSRLHLRSRRMKALGAIAFALTILTIFLTGCGVSREARLASSREVLTDEEITKTAALTAYEAIRIRRPAFLVAPGEKSFGDADRSLKRPVVYVNSVYYGKIESLKEMPVHDIREIRFLDPLDATRMFGTVHAGGVILVNTKLN